MEITSFQFFVMVGISLLVYWLVPHRYQWLVLLFDSLVFYFANATWYTFLYVCVSVGTTHAATLYFARAGQGAAAQKKKKYVLAGTIALNVGILAVLKYTNLAIRTFNFFGSRVLHIQGISDVAWLAPLAISYYTLQLIAYAVDCGGGVRAI